MLHSSLEQERVPAPTIGAARAITSVGPAPRDVWRDLYARDHNALVTQSPEWVDCLCGSGRYRDASLMLEHPNGRTVVLPMVRRTNLPGPVAALESMPASWGIGGLIAPDGMRAEDAAAALGALAARSLARFSIRPNPIFADAWSAGGPSGLIRVPRLAHVLDLTGGFDRVWSQRFQSSTRNHVRHAERAGLAVECDTAGRFLPMFLQLFDLSVARWARLQHEPLALARFRARMRDPRRKFRAIAESLREHCRFWYAWKGRQPVAAILVLQDANANYARGVMDEALVGNSYANYLLHRMAIEDACRTGCRTYHMGETGRSRSLAQFKRQFGAEAFPYFELRLELRAVRWLDQATRSAVKATIGFRDA